MEKVKPIIAITMGDPAGIGPEVMVRALRQPSLARRLRPVIVGNAEVIAAAAKLCRSGLKVREITDLGQAKFHGKNLEVLQTPALAMRPITPGRWTWETGRASFAAVELAAALAMAGAVDGMVTAPICKEAWHAAGVRVPGHTELLAKLTRAPHHAMMFVNGPFRLVLVTIHTALKSVPKLITAGRIQDVIRVGVGELQTRFGIPRPRVAVAGLNPHAGEAGLFGREERDIIGPAVKRLAQQTGWEIQGPFPPDTLFAEARQANYDLIVCMYHDQGLIPFKMLALHQGVNVTAGLPIIRTSPDHGTAFDLAGTGRANAGSMAAAIRVAIDMVRHRGVRP